MTAQCRPIPPADLVSEVGGSYSKELGIDLACTDGRERFKWFLAAMLYGAPISQEIATRTWKEFARTGVLSPHAITVEGWNGLVSILDSGGYARYDFKTATKLLSAATSLSSTYGGNLDWLHEAADGPRDLEARLKALSKGIGDITVTIFLRELRGIWSKADPPLSPLARLAGLRLGYLRKGRNTERHDLERLQEVWDRAGQPASRFPDFEASLVRKGLSLRRREQRHPFSRTKRA